MDDIDAGGSRPLLQDGCSFALKIAMQKPRQKTHTTGRLKHTVGLDHLRRYNGRPNISPTLAVMSVETRYLEQPIRHRQASYTDASGLETAVQRRSTAFAWF